MTEEAAGKFAAKLIELYGHEKRIEVNVPIAEAPAVIAALEKLSCAVDYSPAGNLLTVHCPVTVDA